jgi:TolB-like protein
VANDLDRLTVALAERYAIERELGSGGMATVYLAQDLKHDRQVALKVLKPELAHAVGADRFLREIRITAGLNHPHILPLLDSGEADGFLYFVMPYVAGESLRARLDREGPLPIDEALRIAEQVASALEHAHSHEVIHRDIKPENILLHEGEAMVADFGIAVAVSVAGGERLTETGIAVGTPAFMSPEQASGDERVDERSDIYSLGCVLYEMVGGEPPHGGASPREILAQKVLSKARSIRELRPEADAALEAVLGRALEAAPEDRFATAGELGEALRSPEVGWTLAAKRLRARRLRVGGVAAVGLMVVVLGVGAILHYMRGQAEPIRLAVLPFEYIGAAEDEYYADGMIDEIRTKLNNVGALLVIGRSSSVQSKEAEKTIAEIGEELGVDYLVDGTFRQVRLEGGESSVRVIPELIRVLDGASIWTESYNAAGLDIFDVQIAIAQQVAEALAVNLLGAEREAIQARPTDNLEAYDAYLRGNQLPMMYMILLTDRTQAIEMYERAVELDPRFAEAHARLSIHYSGLAWDRLDEAERVLPLAQRHAERALELKPDLAFGHLARASYERASSGDWERVLPHLVRAEQANPNSDAVLEQLTYAYYRRWDVGRIYSYGMRALELNPLNGRVAMWVGLAHWGLSNRPDRGPPGLDVEQFPRLAVQYFDRAIELSPDDPTPYMFKTYFCLSMHGSLDEARAVLQGAVQRMGLERAVSGFLRSTSWGSGILAADEWYRGLLERVSLGAPDVDSTNYYTHKAALYDALAQTERARAYHDSAASLLEAQLGMVPRALASWAHGELAYAYAGLGRAEDAKREIGVAAAYPAWDRVGPASDAAQVYAKVGELDLAVELFESVVNEGGFISRKWLSLDPTLAPLRDHPRFRALLGEQQ